MKQYSHILAALYIVAFTCSAISPAGYDIWLLEIIPVLIIFLLLIFSYNSLKFSNTSYTFMVILLILHTSWVPYTFANILCTFIITLAFALFIIMAFATACEVIEWWFRVTQRGEAGVKFLGFQGDIWDTQKDILSGTLSAIFDLIIFHIVNKTTYKKEI